MSTQDDIDDALTRHQIFVLRYARGREVEAELHIARQLETVIARLEDGDITEFSRGRLQSQARDLYEYLRASNSEFAEQYVEELTRFANYEAEFNARIGSRATGVDFSIPAPVQMQSAIFTDIMALEPSKGYTIRSMLDEFGSQGANLVVEQIRDSVVLGETTQQLTSKIRGLIPTQQRKAATVARTAVNHVSTQARKETAKENDDILDGYKWVSTLDSLTSMICMSRDGVIYKDFDNDPKPPAHFNCRSTITFKVKPEFDLGADDVGERPSIGPKGAKKVKGDVTYDQWLRKQPKGFQDQVLGKGRAELFRGGMTLDKFVDDRGEVISLAQLSLLDQDYVIEQAVPVVPISGTSIRFDDINESGEISSDDLTRYLELRLSPELSELVTKTARPRKITTLPKQGSYYEAVGKQLNQRKYDDEETGYVFAHEYGHHIDYEISGSRYSAFSENSTAFKKAFLEDRKELGLRASKTKVEALKQLSDDLYDVEIKTMSSGRTFQKKKRKGVWESLASDIVDAMSGGAFYKSGHWGHGVGYYKRRGSKEKETFANLFAMRGDPEAWRYCQRRFPRLCKVFDEIVDDYLKSGVNSYDG